MLNAHHTYIMMIAHPSPCFMFLFRFLFFARKCQGKFHHEAKNHKMPAPQITFPETQQEIIDRGLDLISALKAKIPGAMISGMVRVDMMKHNGHIIINEFESLEATFYAMENSDRNSYEAETLLFLIKYWELNITEALQLGNDMVGEFCSVSQPRRLSSRKIVSSLQKRISNGSLSSLFVDK